MSNSDIIVKTLDIPMRDGVLLKADLFIKNTNSPKFTLLQRTPYDRDCSISLINALDLAKKGWAVVIQNVRGRLSSGGEFLPFLQEQADGIDTLNWVSSQSWSNGKIAMSGTSYCGFTQWSCSYGLSKNLGAISPQLTASNVLDHWFYENGLFRQSFAQSWGLSLSHTSVKNEKQRKEIINIARNLIDLYKIPPEESPLKDLFPPYINWISPEDKEYWKKVGKIERSESAPIPAFHLTGWYDIFCEGAIEDYKIQEYNATVAGTQNQRLVIGPWGHNTLFQHRVGQVNFGYEADGFTEGLMEEVHQWLFNALDKRPLRIGARIFVMGENKWREYSSWPIAPKELTKLYLSANKHSPNNLLQLNSSSSNDSNILFYDPLQPEIFLGGRTLDPASLDSGPFDHAGVIQSKGSLIFEFPLLNQAITIIGETFIQLFVQSKNPSIILSFTIFDKHPNGRIFNIVSRSYCKEIIPHKIEKFTLSIGNTAYMFKEGHSICLKIASSHFPHLVDQYSSNSYQESEVFFGIDYPSHLLLPAQT